MEGVYHTGELAGFMAGGQIELPKILGGGNTLWECKCTETRGGEGGCTSWGSDIPRKMLLYLIRCYQRPF